MDPHRPKRRKPTPIGGFRLPDHGVVFSRHVPFSLGCNGLSAVSPAVSHPDDKWGHYSYDRNADAVDRGDSLDEEDVYVRDGETGESVEKPVDGL